MSNNALTGGIPPELGGIGGLRYLHLNNNRLDGDIPAALGNLVNLWQLHLRGNRLGGCLPAAWRGISDTDLGQLGLPFCD